MIYVDSTRFYPHSSLFCKYWCHLFTDGDIETLHVFARRIGLNQTWFINNPTMPYYDVVPATRKLALEMGAEEISEERLKELFVLQVERRKRAA